MKAHFFIVVSVFSILKSLLTIFCVRYSQPQLKNICYKYCIYMYSNIDTCWSRTPFNPKIYALIVIPYNLIYRARNQHLKYRCKRLCRWNHNYVTQWYTFHVPVGINNWKTLLAVRVTLPQVSIRYFLYIINISPAGLRAISIKYLWILHIIRALNFCNYLVLTRGTLQRAVSICKLYVDGTPLSLDVLFTTFKESPYMMMRCAIFTILKFLWFMWLLL